MVITQDTLSYSTIKKSKILEGLDEETKEKLAKTGKIFTVQVSKSKSEELQIEHSVYLLLNGKAFLSCIEPDGRKLITENLDEGSFFGNLNFDLEEGQPLKGVDNCLFLEPISKGEIKLCVFHKNDFLEILSESPTLAIKVLSSEMARVSQLEQKVEELVFWKLETKILMELIKLSEPQDQEMYIYRLKTKITHAKLAEATGTARETVSRAFTRLKKAGFIYYDKGKNLIIKLTKEKVQQPLSNINLPETEK